MTIIHEVTKKDGTRQLIPDTIFKRIVESVNEMGYTQELRRIKMFGQMLANACYCHGWTRVDRITYGLDCPVRRENIIRI